MSAPSKTTRPAAGLCAPGDRPQERRLPCAVRSDERHSLALGHRERDPAHRRQQPVPGLDPLEREQAHAGTPPRYASTTAASRITASGSPSAITRPASRQTRRSTICTSTRTMCSIQTIATPLRTHLADRLDELVGLGVGEPRADLVEQQHHRIRPERPRQLELLAVEQPEALGPAVREPGQGAQLEHLDAARIRGLAAQSAARRASRRRRSRTRSCRRTASAPGGRGRSRAGSAG